MRSLFQINTTCNRGSTGRIAEMIGQTAKENDYDCYLAYGRYHQPSELNVVKVGSRLSIYTHFVFSRLFDAHGLLSRRATAKLIETIKDIGPSIIHLHNIHGYYLNYPILFKYLSECESQIVWTLHDCWPITGHCSHFDYLGCDRWRKGCGSCPGLSVYPKSVFIDRSRSNYVLKRDSFRSVLDRLTIVPVSEWLGSIVKDSFLGDARIKIIHNGVDTSVFNIKTDKYPGLDPKKKTILGVASVWNDRKGLNDFFNLSSILGHSYQVVLVGLSESQMKKLPKNIMGIRRTESVEELVVLYSNADVFVNPTYEDSFPTTNIEALACGTPVVTYRTGGSVEAVSSDTGIVVPKGDIEELKQAIVKICGNGKDQYISACRERAVSLYDMRDRFQEYIELYNSLI